MPCILQDLAFGLTHFACWPWPEKRTAGSVKQTSRVFLALPIQCGRINSEDVRSFLQSP
jgi:hypothetical protein